MKRTNDLQLSRRQALAVIGAVAAAPLAYAANAAEAEKGIALQLYTLREQAKADLPGTLKKTREIGWEYVQWSGMPNLPAEKIREALDTAGLKAVSAHTGIEPFERDFDASVKFWKTVGVTDLAPGGMMNDCRENLQAWLNGAKRLDTIGAKLREAGLRLSYHNHDFELQKFPEDPRPKLDILFESTKPENLFAEFDLAWVHVSGADPAAYIRKYKNRCPVIHVKDYAEKAGRHVKFTPLGKGILEWPDIFAAGKEAGIEWYVYEQDNGDGDPFTWAQISYEFLKKSL